MYIVNLNRTGIDGVSQNNDYSFFFFFYTKKLIEINKMSVPENTIFFFYSKRTLKLYHVVYFQNSMIACENLDNCNKKKKDMNMFLIFFPLQIDIIFSCKICVLLLNITSIILVIEDTTLFTLLTFC